MASHRPGGRTAVLAAERTGSWNRRRGTTKQSIALRRPERLILNDWLYLRPPLSSLLNDAADPFIFDGRHRLWLAGRANAWPLPILSVELSDIVRGDLQGTEALTTLRSLEQVILETQGTAGLNTRHLSNIHRAIQAVECQT